MRLGSPHLCPRIGRRSSLERIFASRAGHPAAPHAHPLSHTLIRDRIEPSLKSVLKVEEQVGLGAAAVVAAAAVAAGCCCAKRRRQRRRLRRRRLLLQLLLLLLRLLLLLVLVLFVLVAVSTPPSAA